MAASASRQQQKMRSSFGRSTRFAPVSPGLMLSAPFIPAACLIHGGATYGGCYVSAALATLAGELKFALFSKLQSSISLAARQLSDI